jgi:hypothetical protein
MLLELKLTQDLQRRGPARRARRARGPVGLGPAAVDPGRPGPRSRGRASGSRCHADGRLDRVGGACGTNLAQKQAAAETRVF